MALRNLVPEHSWPTSQERWTLWSANFNGVQPQNPQCLCTETKDSHTRTTSGRESSSDNLISTCYPIFHLSENTNYFQVLMPQHPIINSDGLLSALECAAGRTGPELSPYGKLWSTAKAGTSAAIMNSLLAVFSYRGVPSNWSAFPSLWFGWETPCQLI